jgi:hypothetical protein
MRTSYRALAVGGALALAIAFGATSDAFAKGGRGGGHGASMGGGPGWAGGTPPGFARGEKTGFVDGRPPGWSKSKGKKKGWGTGTMPPGLSR